MFIEQITLKNIKSYGQTPTVINFKEGVNLIAGTNGAGKSTLLEAIGFTLFDALPYAQKDFKRRGASGASQIIVRLHSDYDGRVYDIERGIPAKYQITDEANINVGVESKHELYTWLCQHLKVDTPENLKPLFENAIGVQQGTITAVFLANKAGREATFNSLLGIQDYKTAHSNLNDTRKYIADLIIENDKSIARLEGQTESLPSLQQEHTTIQNNITETQDVYEENAKTIITLETEVTQLAEQKTAIDNLQHQLEQLAERVQQHTTTMEAAQKNLEQSQNALTIITDNYEAHEYHQDAVSTVKLLEEKHKKYEKLQQQKQDIDKQLVSDKKQLENVLKQLEDVATAQAKLEQLKPLVDQQKELEDKLATAKDSQKQRDQLQKQLTTNQKKAKKLQSGLDTMRKEVAKRNELEEAVQANQGQRDELAQQLEELDEQRQGLQTDVDNAQEAFDNADEQHQAYQRKQDELESKRDTLSSQQTRHNQIEASVKERADLEAQMDALTAQINTADNETSLAENTIQRATDNLAEQQTARAMLSDDDAVCPVCRREMDGQAHQEAIDYYDSQEKQLLDEQAQAEQTLTDNQKSLKTWKRELKKLEKQIDKLDNQVALDNINADIQATETEITQLETDLEAMQDIPQSFELAEKALTQAQNTLTAHDEQVSKIKAKRESLAEQIAELNADIAKLTSQKELDSNTSEYDALVKTIENDQERFDELQDIDTTVSDLQAELAELDNPREQYAIAENTANNRPQLETEQANIQESIDNKQSQLDELETDLSQYATLADDLSEARQMRDDNAKGHQQYLENKQVADLFEEREQALEQAEQTLSDAQSEQATIQADLEQAEQSFDNEHYEEQQQTLQKLNNTQIELNTKIKEQIKQRDTLKTEIDELNKVIDKIKKLEATGKQLSEQQEAFSFVRSGIRDAGPRIRQKKVEFVSQVASNYFSEIINDYTMRLHWNAEDYGIEVEQSGETRPFSVLSGGEQMIAALSVRLALLTHMTHARLIFLDEPTINLDENRRIQLAERLSQIKGLNQLFVISHDDTFISDSNHVITVTKDGDVSQVETSHATVY